MSTKLLLPMLLTLALAPAVSIGAPSATTSATASAIDPAEVLGKVTQAYRSFESYHFAGAMKVEVKVQGQNQNVEMPFTLAATKPGKKRVEITNPMLQLEVVSDGDSTWMYVPQLGQYTKKVVTPLEKESTPLGSAASGTPLARYLAMSDGLVQSRLVGERTLEFDGRPRSCWVIEAEYRATASIDASPTTFWIEKQRHVVLRESTLVKMENSPAGGPMSMNQVTQFHVVRVGEALPDSLFTFTPPEGSRLVEEIAVPGAEPPESELIGRPAAPFTLKNLVGKTAGPASWRGKVVLLDFWASWCGPCRIEMPTIAKLDKELKSKGLVVVGVNVGESASVASAYMKKNQYAFSVLLDSDSRVSEKYGASGLPTVVIIDKMGNVSSHFIGVRSEDVLRGALKKAGIE